MCTMITEKAEINGKGKGPKGWFSLKQVYVSYDHPEHLPCDEAINIDFVDHSSGPDCRIAVELTSESAQLLVAAINLAVERGCKP